MSNCICGHDEKSHVLLSYASSPKKSKRCTECNDCMGYVQSAVETALKEWSEEAHRKMYEKDTELTPEMFEDANNFTGPVSGTKMEQGKKFDGDKLRLDLIPTVLLRGVAWILTFGAVKYGDRNWEQGILYHRVWGALLRHLMSWYEGEANDPESGKPHLWHAACNLSFLMHFEENKDKYESFDDRPNL